MLAAVVAAPVLAFVGYGAMLTIDQRAYLYETDDHGALAAAGGMAIAGSQRITIVTSDRVRIAGWYVAPRPGQPVVLFLHGQGGMLVRQIERWKQLRGQGFGVLAISYRGYPGSEGTPNEHGLDLDALAAYDWLRARFAPHDIVVSGHSLGTGVAVWLATRVEARALLLEAPFTAAVDVAAERMPWYPVGLMMLDQFRSRDIIGKVRCPVLIVHGEDDHVVPVAQADRLYKLVRAPKEIVRVPGGTHNGLPRDGLYQDLARFLATTAP